MALTSQSFEAQSLKDLDRKVNAFLSENPGITPLMESFAVSKGRYLTASGIPHHWEDYYKSITYSDAKEDA